MIIKPIKGSAALLIAPLMIPAPLCRITPGSLEATIGMGTLTHTHTHTHRHTALYAASTYLSLP